jgi:uncharacterized protein
VIAVVCDSNVYISAVVFGGSPRQVLSLAEQGKIRLFVSPTLMSEVESVLERKFEWEPRRVRRIGQPLWKAAVLLEPETEISACRDRKDNHLLALAVDARVGFIITGDKDLLVLHPFRGVQITSPAQFLETEGLK